MDHGGRLPVDDNDAIPASLVDQRWLLDHGSQSLLLQRPIDRQRSSPFASQKLALEICCLSTHCKPDRLPQERRSITFRKNKAFLPPGRIGLTLRRASRFSSRHRRPRSSRSRIGPSFERVSADWLRAITGIQRSWKPTICLRPRDKFSTRPNVLNLGWAWVLPAHGDANLACLKSVFRAGAASERTSRSAQAKQNPAAAKARPGKGKLSVSAYDRPRCPGSHGSPRRRWRPRRKTRSILFAHTSRG
jgi:hypothetical protein